MTHFKEFQLFEAVLQFVRFAKELEFYIKTEYSLTEENILRCLTKKELPHQGVFFHKGDEYTWRIHGIGITYHCKEFRFHYNMNSEIGCRVTFHSQTVNDFIRDFKLEVDFKPEETEELLRKLWNRMLLQKIWKDYEVYSLV